MDYAPFDISSSLDDLEIAEAERADALTSATQDAHAALESGREDETPPEDSEPADGATEPA